MPEHSTGSGADSAIQPRKDTYRTLTDFVKNYWDLGAAITAGLAVNDANSELFGAYRGHATFLPAILSVIGAGSNFERFSRNFYAGLATLALRLDSNGAPDFSNGDKIASNAVAILLGYISNYFDRVVRRERLPKYPQGNTSGGPIDSLESRV